MERHRTAAVAIVLLVVLAGCSAPTLVRTDEPDPDHDEPAEPDPRASPEPGATPSLDDEVDVDGGELPVDPDLLFARVERLTGADVTPNGVQLRDLDAGKTTTRTTPVRELLGLGTVRLNSTLPAGLTRPSGQVYFDTQDAGPRLVERRLVHEFVHVVQFRSDWVRTPPEYGVELTRDFVLAWRAVTEGGAVYVTDVYIRRYMDEQLSQSGLLWREYRDGDPAGNRLVYAPYVFGARYVRSQVDSPRELSTVYDTIPKTTEQVMHNLTPGSEPPLPLDVDVDTGTEFDWVRKDRAGELFLRVVLRVELSADRAAAAAAGWGTDAWLAFEGDGGDVGLAWVTRWDGTGEADEFGSALTEYAERREAGTTKAFRVVRLSPDTVVLLAGDDEFVQAASLSGGGDDVSVVVDADRTTLHLGTAARGRPRADAPATVLPAPALVSAE